MKNPWRYSDSYMFAPSFPCRARAGGENREESVVVAHAIEVVKV